MEPTFHLIGDVFVDLFSFLDGDLPEHGGDSRLDQPVKEYPGGSANNTATHLKSLIHHFIKGKTVPSVTLHTSLNPDDNYGQLLLQHASKHGFSIRNCRKEGDEAWTGHCIVIVCGGDRSFMTHLGCIENFTAEDLHIHEMIEADGPVHIHIAGYFNMTGFWHGKLKEQLAHIREERKKRFPNQTTTISLVTQHDGTQQWDGGLDEVLPLLSFLIINELEADRIFQRGRGRERDTSKDSVKEWMSFFSPLNPEAIIVVTRGADGAVAFRNGELIATLHPAVVVDVVDPTGAGDAFAAGFLHGIWAWKRKHGELGVDEWSGAAVKQGLSWGCAAGTAAVKVRGASDPSKPEAIVDLYEQQRSNDAPNLLR